MQSDSVDLSILENKIKNIKDMPDFDIINLNIPDVDTHETQNKASSNEVYKPSADEGLQTTSDKLYR